MDRDAEAQAFLADPDAALRNLQEPVLIEVKADAAPDVKAARHLISMRDRFGPEFLAGIVLHTGPRTYALSERIVAAPVSTLWATA